VRSGTVVDRIFKQWRITEREIGKIPAVVRERDGGKDWIKEMIRLLREIWT